MQECEDTVDKLEEFSSQNHKLEDRVCNQFLREALRNAGLNNCEMAIAAVEDFLCKIELFDPNVAFEGAALLLLQAAVAFGLLDDNHDLKLTPAELAHHVDLADYELRQVLEWVLAHYDAIQRMRFPDHKDGITRRDLLAASDFFLGLNFVHLNFEKFAHRHHSIDKTLTYNDIESYLSHHENSIAPRERNGLKRLITYLKDMAQDNEPVELTDAQLAKLSLPEQRV